MIAEVRLWGRTIGAVTSRERYDYASFQYTPEFAAAGIEVAPLTLPLSDRVYEFTDLPRDTFRGLPGLLADSLPDKFGNTLIDAWLATKGRTADSFDPIERLCYVGSRGMGALEFRPERGPKPGKATAIAVDALVRLASEVLAHRERLAGSFDTASKRKALADILRVGTSAGGARAKAVIAWNPHTNEVRSGQVDADEGFEHWLLKFDGVTGNKDKELEDPKGYGAIEFAYSLMARAAGIDMTPCRLLEEHGRRHFMTRRFDRLAGNQKVHMLSLGAIAHFDFNQPGAHAYEQAFLTVRELGLPASDLEQQFRRMVFNIVARNQDDHVKNIAFLMDKAGRWSLSPAFDVTYIYNPSGSWTASHQMTLNGRRDGFTMQDIRLGARSALLKRRRADAITDEVLTAVARWSEFAAEADLPNDVRTRIHDAHRLDIPKA